MTIKEKLETIKGKKVIARCDNEYRAESLAYEFHTITGEDYITCYDCESEMFCIMNLEDATELLNKNKIQLTQQDINQILNDKYGKDNWVIK